MSLPSRPLRRSIRGQRRDGSTNPEPLSAPPTASLSAAGDCAPLFESEPESEQLSAGTGEAWAFPGAASAGPSRHMPPPWLAQTCAGHSAPLRQPGQQSAGAQWRGTPRISHFPEDQKGRVGSQPLQANMFPHGVTPGPADGGVWLQEWLVSAMVLLLQGVRCLSARVQDWALLGANQPGAASRSLFLPKPLS